MKYVIGLWVNLQSACGSAYRLPTSRATYAWLTGEPLAVYLSCPQVKTTYGIKLLILITSTTPPRIPGRSRSAIQVTEDKVSHSLSSSLFYLCPVLTVGGMNMDMKNG